jgi:predicted nucleotidyltransferase
MLTLTYIKQQLTVLKPILQKKYPLANMAIFGSYARNEATEKSDVDVLVELNGKIGIQFIDMADEIEACLGIKTDIITKNSLKSNYYEHIKQDLIYI